MSTQKLIFYTSYVRSVMALLKKHSKFHEYINQFGNPKQRIIL